MWGMAEFPKALISIKQHGDTESDVEAGIPC